jgi:hypothetical protein
MIELRGRRPAGTLTLDRSLAGHGSQSTLVLGGSRSGKSRYAESLITSLPPPWIYLASAEPRD